MAASRSPRLRCSSPDHPSRATCRTPRTFLAGTPPLNHRRAAVRVHQSTTPPTPLLPASLATVGCAGSSHPSLSSLHRCKPPPPFAFAADEAAVPHSAQFGRRSPSFQVVLGRLRCRGQPVDGGSWPPRAVPDFIADRTSWSNLTTGPEVGPELRSPTGAEVGYHLLTCSAPGDWWHIILQDSPQYIHSNISQQNCGFRPSRSSTA